jgi:hypothetical protein
MSLCEAEEGRGRQEVYAVRIGDEHEDDWASVLVLADTLALGCRDWSSLIRAATGEPVAPSFSSRVGFAGLDVSPSVFRRDRVGLVALVPLGEKDTYRRLYGLAERDEVGGLARYLSEGYPDRWRG